MRYLESKSPCSLRQEHLYNQTDGSAESSRRGHKKQHFQHWQGPPLPACRGPRAVRRSVGSSRAGTSPVIAQRLRRITRWARNRGDSHRPGFCRPAGLSLTRRKKIDGIQGHPPSDLLESRGVFVIEGPVISLSGTRHGQAPLPLAACIFLHALFPIAFVGVRRRERIRHALRLGRVRLGGLEIGDQLVDRRIGVGALAGLEPVAQFGQILLLLFADLRRRHSQSSSSARRNEWSSRTDRGTGWSRQFDVGGSAAGRRLTGGLGLIRGVMGRLARLQQARGLRRRHRGHLDVPAAIPTHNGAFANLFDGHVADLGAHARPLARTVRQTDVGERGLRIRGTAGPQKLEFAGYGAGRLRDRGFGRQSGGHATRRRIRQAGGLMNVRKKLRLFDQRRGRVLPAPEPCCRTAP